MSDTTRSINPPRSIKLHFLVSPGPTLRTRTHHHSKTSFPNPSSRVLLCPRHRTRPLILHPNPNPNSTSRVRSVTAVSNRRSSPPRCWIAVQPCLVVLASKTPLTDLPSSFHRFKIRPPPSRPHTTSLSISPCLLRPGVAKPPLPYPSTPPPHSSSTLLDHAPLRR
ncbi:putative formin-like protein 20 [Iris pallida]|uniref:Formin-like protein 20 n=1 Tax=Iris pallida TaxID=29817 RepID=A0AAX6GSL4_IRIPA|nr:putative formin-like protein 20 [Iris pallida]